MDLLANAGMVIVIWYGGLLVIRQAVTIGELVAFTTYLGQLATPVRHLGLLIPAIAMASSAAERIFEIMDTDTEIEDRPDAQPLPAVQGEVTLENVSYAFIPGYPVLRDINFTARPGEVVALLGATGSGKSTITGLIPRFYDPDTGRVCIDGQDIRRLSLPALRRHIGIVLQETILFATTVRENIAYGRPEATEEEIVAAAKAAQAHKFITTQLPEGYDTHVGEKGTTLSGGQKQRLAIARALLTDPKILILDDATASVDTETERYIQQALQQLMIGRTTFVIAHRLSTVRRADQILLLHKGRIVARGTHKTLLQDSPRYREVYSQQLQPDPADLPAPELESAVSVRASGD
jgi:ATP-binding cassette subfamily B protein